MFFESLVQGLFMFKRISPVFFVSLFASAAVQAQPLDLLDVTPKLCASAADGSILQEGFRKSAEKPAHPFGTVMYTGVVEKTDVVVTVGEKFGDALCETYFPKASESRYEGVDSLLRMVYRGNGTVYDNPKGGNGYRGEIWADQDAVSGGKVKNLRFGRQKASTVFIQYASKGFQQTEQRAGIMIEVTYPR